MGNLFCDIGTLDKSVKSAMVARTTYVRSRPGRIGLERWSDSSGTPVGLPWTRGRFALESAVGLAWNTQEMSFGPSQHAERADVQASSLQAAHAPLDMSFGPSQHAVDQDLVPKPIPGPAAAVLLAIGAMDNGAVAESQRDAINAAIDAICTNPPAAGSLGEAWRTSLKLGFDNVEFDTVEDGGVDVKDIKDTIDMARILDRRGNATKVLRFKPGIAYDDLPDHDQIFIAVLRADEGTGYRVVYPNWGDLGDGPGIAFGALNDQGDPEITIPEAGPELPHLKRQALAGEVAYVLYQPLEGAE